MSEPYWEPLGAQPVLPGMNVIQDILLGADAANIDFAAIPQIYKHLELVLSLRVSGAVTLDVINLRFNGDSGANYHSLWTGWSLAASDSFYNVNAAHAHIGKAVGASGDAATFGVGKIIIPDYASGTKKKNFRSEFSATYGLASNTSSALIIAALWASIVAINRITLLPNGGSNFVTGSRATLYGLS